MINNQTNRLGFIKNLLLPLLVLIMAIITGCQNNNHDTLEKSTGSSEIPGKTAYVVNTSQDTESPWLSFRAEPKEDGKMIYMLPDGTKLKIIGEDSTGGFVKVQLIDNIGYVSKKFLSDSLVSTNKNLDILSITKLILEDLKKGKTNELVNYMYNNTIEFFYWKISKSQLLNGDYKYAPDYIGTNDISGQPFRVRIKNYLDFSEWNAKYLTNEGKGYFPAAGFGGGSVQPPDKEDYVVRIAEPTTDMPGHELWFVFKKVNNTYKLKTIGDWDWSP